jgi:hypothetical protein
LPPSNPPVPDCEIAISTVIRRPPPLAQMANDLPAGGDYSKLNSDRT